MPEASDSASPIRRMSLWPPPRSTRHSTNRRRRALVAAITGAVLALVAGCVAVVWALSPGTEPDDGTGVPAAYAGTWSGEMSQRNEAGEHVVDWGASLKLEAGSQRGTAEWFTLDCRGTITLTERTDEGLAFDYVETYDPEQRCIEEVSLSLRRGASEETLEAEWVAPSHDGTLMTSTGNLK
ncbi:hypothetical protein GCM10022205_02800 [Spinactinospora alkalitolerans]